MSIKLFEIAYGAAALMSVPVVLASLSGDPHSAVPMAETVLIPARTIDFPLPGEFLAADRPMAAPVEAASVESFRIMKRQVSLNDYGRCVAAGVCKAPDAPATTDDVPVTGINGLDADAYARWYSQATGESWRLPTAQEAAAAGAERFAGESFSAVGEDPGNPAVRWIRRYREEAAAKRPADPRPKLRGSYGPNSLGVEDFGGNVWEWTSTCYNRVTVTPSTHEVLSIVENCGVRVLEGRHRAYMSGFVRDGRSGGCAVGTPPENLGMRLVRDDHSPAVAAARRTLAKLKNAFTT